MNVFSFAVALISSIVAIHLYLSVNFLINYLASFDLSYMTILAWDDVRFIMAQFNNKLLILLVLICCLSFPFFTSFGEKVSAKNKISEQVQSFIKNNKIRSLVSFLYKKRRTLLLFLLLVLGVLGVLGFMLHNVYLVLFFIYILCLVVYLKCRNLLIVYVCFMLLTSFFIYRDLERLTSEKPFFSNIVKFKFENGEVVTSDSEGHRLIFWGARYVILENDRNSVKLYPTSTIKEVEWNKENR